MLSLPALNLRNRVAREESVELRTIRLNRESDISGSRSRSVGRMTMLAHRAGPGAISPYVHGQREGCNRCWF